jgi:uncharacterized protein
MPESASWRVWVVASLASRQIEQEMLTVVPGACVQDALSCSALFARWRAGVCAEEPLTLGLWGRKATMQTGLNDGDRIELYRVLKVDPKVARRERFRKQGTRSAGLFSRQRPGGKAGY